MDTWKRTKEQLIFLLLFVTHGLFLLLIMEIFFQAVQMRGNTYRENLMKCNFYFIRNIYALKK